MLLHQLRVCVCCQRELHMHAFRRKFSRHKNGKIVFTRQCRRCLREKRMEGPSARRSKAFLIEARSQPCTACGQRVHPDATVFVPPPNARYGVVTDAGKISLERLRQRVAASTLLCANCWQVQRVARRRATKRVPVQVSGITAPSLRAALNAQESRPDVADVPLDSAETHRPPAPPAQGPTDIEREGRGVVPQVDGA